MTDARSTLASLLTPEVAETTFGRLDAPWAVLSVRGPDAVDFVHRLCSQDVVGMAVGTVRPAAFLDGKGRLRAMCRVARGTDELWLECAAGDAARLYDLLDRYHITERLTLERHEAWSCAEVIGPRAAAIADAAAGTWSNFGDGLVLVEERHGVIHAHWHAPASECAALPWRAGGNAAGVTELTDELAELLRIAAGRATFGRDADETTLALEADLDDHVSTAKGCYTGQEIMARLRTYGHLNRRLCLLEVTGPDPLASGTELAAPTGGKAVGRVTTSAVTPDAARRLALGVVSRDHWTTGTVLRSVGAEREVRVVGWQPAAKGSESERG